MAVRGINKVILVGRLGKDPEARNRASGFGGDWQVRQQLPVGVGPDDRMPPGSREPKVRPADRTTLL